MKICFSCFKLYICILWFCTAITNIDNDNGRICNILE